MNCEQANQIDLVDDLYLVKYQHQKISKIDHCYLSLLRRKQVSFEVNRNKNVMYDHGPGKGGDVTEFAIYFFSCDVSKALQNFFSFHQPKNLLHPTVKTSLYQHQKVRVNRIGDTAETSIKIKAAKQLITELFHSSYLKLKKIKKSIANKCCSEVFVELNNKSYKAIAFKNAESGYEFKNEFSKGGSSTKYDFYFNSKNAKSITGFKSFFEFLSYQTIHQNQGQQLTNFLIQNSPDFFEMSLLSMDKHNEIRLYLNDDEAVRKCILLTQKRSAKFTMKISSTKCIMP